MAHCPRLGVLSQHVRSSAVAAQWGVQQPATARAAGELEPPPTAAQREHYDRLGYVIIDGLVPPDMVRRLLEASNRLVDEARSGSPPEWLASSGRTMTGAGDDSSIDMTRPNPQGRRHTRGEPWHVAGVYHPKANAPVFLEFLGLPRLLDTAQRFLGGAELMLGDTGIFTNTPELDMSIGWHRDMAWFRPGDFSEATERAVWDLRTYDRSPGADTSGRMTDNDDRRINASNRTPEGRGRIKWHMPLLRDATFGIVSGSHLRWRTDEERAVLGHYNGDPACVTRAAAGGGSKHSELSTGIQLDLQPGQCLFWNGDCIHRGDTKAAIERRTLITNCESWDPNQTIDAVRARGGSLTQRADLVWKCQPEVRASMPTERMRVMYDRWLATQPYAVENGLLHSV